MSQLSHKELSRRLRRLGKAINKNIRYPNHGGCGVIASLAGQVLLDLGYEVEVAVPAYGAMPATVRGLVPENNRAASAWREQGVEHAHLAIRFRSGGRTYTWDSAGLCRRCGEFGEPSEWRGKGRRRYVTSPRFGDGHTVREVALISSRQSGWNRQFDRRQIPTIRTLVEYHLRLGL